MAMIWTIKARISDSEKNKEQNWEIYNPIFDVFSFPNNSLVLRF